jgi:hypothetical protein
MWIIVLPALVFIVDFGELSKHVSILHNPNTLAALGMSVWCTWSVHQAIAGKSVLTSTVFARLKYFFIATLVLNLLCTGRVFISMNLNTDWMYLSGLIAYKIWHTAHKVAGYSRVSTGSKALSIILESGLSFLLPEICRQTNAS